MVINPSPTVNEAVNAGFNRRTHLLNGNVYAWEKVNDATQTPDLRYRLLRASSTPATPPTAGTVVSDVANASTNYFVSSVTYDDTYFYQCTSKGGTRVPLSASNATPTQIFGYPAGVTASTFECVSIVVTATDIFFVNREVVAGIDKIYKLPLASIGPTAVPTLVPNIGNRDRITSLTVSGANFFWFEIVLADNASSPRLVTAPITGAAPITIDKDLGNNSATVVSDGAFLYWTDTHGGIGEVRRTPLPYVANAVPQKLMQDLDGVRAGIVMDAANVYVMEANNPSGNYVYKIKKDGSGSKDLGIAFVNNNGQHKGLQMTGVDATHVYFLLFDGIVARLPIGP